MSEIGVTAAQEFMPGSRVSVHRAAGPYSRGMEGPELEAKLAGPDGSVSFSTLSGLDVQAGDPLWVVGRNPAGAEHCVSMTAKALTSAGKVKATQALTVTEDVQEGTHVRGARTTQNTKPKPRKASPKRKAKASKK